MKNTSLYLPCHHCNKGEFPELIRIPHPNGFHVEAICECCNSYIKHVGFAALYKAKIDPDSVATATERQGSLF